MTDMFWEAKESGNYSVAMRLAEQVACDYGGMFTHLRLAPADHAGAIPVAADRSDEEIAEVLISLLRRIEARSDTEGKQQGHREDVT